MAEAEVSDLQQAGGQLIATFVTEPALTRQPKTASRASVPVPTLSLPFLPRCSRSGLSSLALVQALLHVSPRLWRGSAGALFALKIEELDLLYQQSFLLENSQQHIHQLAAQINHHTNQTNATPWRGT
jgi:hypothetical protein